MSQENRFIVGLKEENLIYKMIVGRKKQNEALNDIAVQQEVCPVVFFL